MTRDQLTARLGHLRTYCKRLDEDLRQARAVTVDVLRGPLPTDSEFGTTAQSHQNAVDHERDQVVVIVQSCDQVDARLRTITTDDDPALSDLATALDRGEQRAHEIDRWLDLHDDWP